MTNYGTETETTYLDNQGSTIDIISKIQNGDIKQRWKRVNLRIKVSDKRDETTQYLLFSDMIDEKRQAGVLIVRDSDPQTRPCFMVEYPKTDIDGTYFIIRSHTERIV
jgi:hypothetical protein